MKNKRVVSSLQEEDQLVKESSFIDKEVAMDVSKENVVPTRDDSRTNLGMAYNTLWKGKATSFSIRAQMKNLGMGPPPKKQTSVNLEQHTK